MPAQITNLPPNATFDDVKRVLAQLPPTCPLIDLRAYVPLAERSEFIMVGPTGCGKSTLLQQHGLTRAPIPPAPTDAPYIGVFDDNDERVPDLEVVRTITGMLKFERTQKVYMPKYKPLILVESLRWDRIRNYFTYVDPSRIGQLAFPKTAFVEKILSIVGPEWGQYFGQSWTAFLEDARGQFMPELAYAATLALREQTAVTHAKPKALAEAAYHYVQRKSRLHPFLQHMPFIVPDDTKVTILGRPLQLSKARIEGRLYTATRSHKLANPYESKPSWMHAAEIAGIWYLRPQGWYVFAKAYAAGYTTLKQRMLHSLLDAGPSRSV